MITLKKLMSMLKDKAVVDITTGPAGVHLDFGESVGNQKNPVVEYGILTNAQIEVFSSNKLLVTCGPYPPFGCEIGLFQILSKPAVARASFRKDTNAARINFDNGVLLSVMPMLTEERDLYWNMYQYSNSGARRKIIAGYSVTGDEIKPVRVNET